MTNDAESQQPNTTPIGAPQAATFRRATIYRQPDRAIMIDNPGGVPTILREFSPRWLRIAAWISTCIVIANAIARLINGQPPSWSTVGAAAFYALVMARLIEHDRYRRAMDHIVTEDQA